MAKLVPASTWDVLKQLLGSFKVQGGGWGSLGVWAS